MFGHMVDSVLWIPVDREDPDYWNSELGPDARECEPRPRYSTSRLLRRKGPYQSWQDFLARTSEAERMRWCAKKAKVANRPRLMSGAPEVRIAAEEVWEVLRRARGRCRHCGSLALERRPSDPRTGAPRPWEHVGRRIGSLEHVEPRIAGGANGTGNLAWACLWCNTWEAERIAEARDHGGYHPAAKKRKTVRRGGGLERDDNDEQ